MCSVDPKLLLKILQYLQENACVRVSNTDIFLRIFEIFNNTYLENTSGGCFWSLFYPFMYNVEKWPNIL